MALGKTDSRTINRSKNRGSTHTEKKLIAEAVRAALVVLNNIRSAERVKTS